MLKSNNKKICLKHLFFYSAFSYNCAKSCISYFHYFKSLRNNEDDTANLHLLSLDFEFGSFIFKIYPIWLSQTLCEFLNNSLSYSQRTKNLHDIGRIRTHIQKVRSTTIQIPRIISDFNFSKTPRVNKDKFVIFHFSQLSELETF